VWNQIKRLVITQWSRVNTASGWNEVCVNAELEVQVESYWLCKLRKGNKWSCGWTHLKYFGSVRAGQTQNTKLKHMSDLSHQFQNRRNTLTNELYSKYLTIAKNVHCCLHYAWSVIKYVQSFCYVHDVLLRAYCLCYVHTIFVTCILSLLRACSLCYVILSLLRAYCFYVHTVFVTCVQSSLHGSSLHFP
jgi:hypothetical protein